jgi:hypothetical protein
MVTVGNRSGPRLLALLKYQPQADLRDHQTDEAGDNDPEKS